MSDYIIIEQYTYDKELFIQEVNEKLDAGWQLAGGLSVSHDDILRQALVKP